ncbi:MAG: hypothetical protein U0359_35335 [Byssovorax sp.]
MPCLRWPSALLGASLLALSAIGCDAGIIAPSATSAGAGGATSGTTSGTTAATGGGGAGGAEPEVPYCNRGPKNFVCNPYGLALDQAGMSDATYFGLLDQVFRVHFYRPETLFLDRFEKDPTSCKSCELAAAQGYYLVLVVRAGGDAETPTAPPADLDHYKAVLAQVIDRYKASLGTLVIEHEADLPASYAGTPADYLAELEAGCAVAHQHGVHCTDSGISSTSLLFWLARYYADLGHPAEAVRILHTAKGNPDVPASFLDGTAGEPELPAFFATFEDRIDRADALLGGHRMAGVNLANLHWLEPDETTLDEILALVRNRTGCFRLMTDQLGQRNDAGPETEAKLVLTKELGLPFVVWHSVDGGGTRSLVDPDGTLRPTGERFAKLSAGAVCGD